MKNLTKKWYLLLVEDELKEPIKVEVSQERLLSSDGVRAILDTFPNFGE